MARTACTTTRGNTAFVVTTRWHARRFFTPGLYSSEETILTILEEQCVRDESFPCNATPVTTNHIPDKCEHPSERGTTATRPFLVTSNVFPCKADVSAIRANLVDITVLGMASQQRYQQTRPNIDVKCWNANNENRGKEEKKCQQTSPLSLNAAPESVCPPSPTSHTSN